MAKVGCLIRMAAKGGSPSIAFRNFYNQQNTEKKTGPLQQHGNIVGKILKIQFLQFCPIP